MPTVNELTNITNSVIDSTGNTIINAFNTMSDALNAGGDFVTFGSNDRRQGYLGLILGPIYDAVWQNLSVIVTTMLGMEIGDYCNFNDRMYGYMTRLMLINLWEHNTTLAMLCESGSNQANANSQTITHEAQIPPYTKGNNYLENIRNIIAYEPVGQHATNIDIQDGPYKKNNNLFPDDNDQRAEEFTNGDVWSVSDPNSILYKTKCLFRQRKIKSLISRFGTNADANPKETRIPEEGNARTRFGLSHGRNLLTKNAEDNGISYAKNGYNNPYCRVWTHHYQYDKYNKTMRPFENTRKNLDKSHNWGERFKEEDKEKGAWKDGARWDKTVLNGRGDGLINITPHFSGGGKNNIHSKDCMFSIENLAWKDYDPYSFEKALSWEQRGPLGGRIMWFPPYGLTFNETSQAQWNANTFIGRGEDVYTYVNTKRTGTLQFYLIVDHPSILDYVSWYEANRERVKDTDILRYFAGCDPNDVDNSNSLLHYVQPTPLTDEGYLGSKKGERKPAIMAKPKETVPTKVDTVEFFVYFPNNYSGIFDIANIDDGGNGLDANFVVEYLLGGTNAQEEYRIVDNLPVKNLKNFSSVEDMGGTGYEMNTGSGITSIDDDPKNPIQHGIIGNEYAWYKTDSPKKYKPTSKKIWRYRIDGTYNEKDKFEAPGSDNTAKLNNIYSNTYAQTLSTSDSYKDTTNSHLNSSLENQSKNYGGSIPDTAYTFTEVVQAIAEISKKIPVITDFFKKHDDINNRDRVDYLKKLFSGTSSKGNKTSLQQISFDGWSNSHGSNEDKTVNDKRNEILANGRAQTIRTWLFEAMNEFNWNKIPAQPFNTSPSKKVNTNDESALEAKLYRATKCTLQFREDEIVDATETEEKDNTDKFTFYEAENETFANKQLYKLAVDDGSRWIKLEDGQMAKIDKNQDIRDYADEQFWLDVMNGKYEAWEVDAMKYDTGPTAEDSFNNYSLFNKVRYDQEYHFFRRVKEETPLIYEKLMDKIKYFDPAFHSMTPEGFNARCTFLNQCTRQGNTVGVSDKDRLSASNMAFGRPPFCVLRLGDFYNQLIVIDNVNIQYDTSGGVVWDLNDEGVGVQPMLAQVSLNFTFIGGGSLDGPVRQLQNAMSFAYYSNTELYDNRAPQAVYDYDRNLTMGGAGKGGMKKVGDKYEGRFPSVEMYNPEKLN